MPILPLLKLLTPVTSFFSKKTYREASENWRGTSAIYVCILISASWLIVMSSWQQQLVTSLDKANSEINNRLPEFAIRGGKLLLGTDLPLRVHNPQTGELFLIIDPRVESAKNIPTTNTPPKFFVTGSEVVQMGTSGQKTILNMSTLPAFSFAPEKTKEWIALAKKWTMPVLFVLILPVSVFLYMLKSLVLTSTLALIVAHVTERRWSFLGLFRVCVVAGTPSLVARTLSDIHGFSLWTWVLSTLLTVGYVVFGVMSLSPSSQPPSHCSQNPNSTSSALA